MEIPDLAESHWVIKVCATVAATFTLGAVVWSSWLTKPKRSGDWWKLKTACEEVWRADWSTKDKIDKATIDREERMRWLTEMKARLDAQIENPVLLKNDKSLLAWRTAQHAVNMGLTGEEMMAAGRAKQIEAATMQEMPVDPLLPFLALRNDTIQQINLAYKYSIIDSSEPRP